MLLSYAVGANIGFKNTGGSNRIFCFLSDEEEQFPPLQSVILSEDFGDHACVYYYLTSFLNKIAKVPNRVYILAADYPPHLLMNDKGQLNIENNIY